MKTVNIFILLSLIVLFSRCASSNYTVQDKGDTAIIKIEDSTNNAASEFNNIEVELAIITDTSIVAIQYHKRYASEQQVGEVIEISFNSIKNIEIMGYSNSGWVLPVILFQVVPAILITIAAMSSSEDNAFIIAPLLIPAALTTILFATSDEETPSFMGKNLFEEKDKLKAYARYPNGLSTENFIRFLSLHHQTKTKFLLR